MKSLNRLARCSYLLLLAGIGLTAANAQTRTLTVNSTPSTGAAVTVSPPDNASQGNGSTNFTRSYNNGSAVTLVAPFANFVKWTKNGQWYATNPATSVTMDSNITMTAVYTATPVVGPFTNGSFENEFQGWTWTGSQQSVKVKDGLPSTNGLNVIEFNSNNSATDGALSQTFTTTPGTSYSVTFDQGVLSFSNTPQVIQVAITGSSPLITQNFSLTGIGGGNVNYASRSVTFTANSSTTTLTFRDQSSTTSAIDLLLDNVAVNAGSAPVVGTNLLFNGSFESDYNGWTPEGATRIEAPGPPFTTDGLKMLSFNVGESPTDGKVTQSFGTTPGATYSVQFDFGTLGFKDSQQTVRTLVTGNGTLLDRTSSITCRPDFVIVWFPVSHTFVANSGVTTLTLSDASATGNALDGFVDKVRVIGTTGSANTAPVAVADSYSTTTNTPLVVPAAGVLTNDTDAQSNPLTAVLGAGPSNGTLILNTNGGFTYTPSSGYSGPDSFTYRANDGLLDSNIVTVSISVGTVAGGPNILINGSFESNFTGWTNTGNQFIESAAPFAATDGSKLVGFNGGNLPPNAVLSQTFATVVGQPYTLAFDAGVFSYNTNSQTMQVTVNGTASLLTRLITINGAGGGNNRWLPQSFSFVADSASTTLTFRDQSSSTNGLDLTLDNVRVNGASAGNVAPVAVADSYSTPVSTALVVAANGVLGNDSDANSNPLTAVLGSGPSNGNLTLNPNGGFTYTPTSGYTGPDSFTYRANDGSLDSNVVTVSISVNPVVAGALVNGSFENGFTGWTTTGNQVIESSSPYAATNGSKLVGFNGANFTPNAVLAQTFATTPGQSYTLAFDAGVLSYVTAQQKVQVTVDGTSNLLTQVITINATATNSNTWTPRSFTFTANSAATTLTFRDQSPATVGLDFTLDNVSITPTGGGGANVAPVAVADSYSTPLNTALVVPATGVLGNDTDANSNALTAVLSAGPSNGNLTLNPNGGFTYTPTNGYTGPDSFTYRANDGALDSNIATVSLTIGAASPQLLINGSFESNFTGWNNTGNVFIESAAPFAPTQGSKLAGFNGANLAPNAVLSQSFTTVAGQTYTLAFDAGVLSFVSSQQKVLVTVDGTTNRLSQSITINATATNSNLWSPRTFSFVADSAVTTLAFRDQSTATNGLDLTLDNVSVTGASGAPNAAPVAVIDSYSTIQGTPLVVPASGVLTNDSDADLNPLTAVLGTGPTNGTLSLSLNGGFTYTPNGTFTGSDSFTYRANDGVLNSNTVTVSITVSPVSIGGLANGSFETGTFAPWTTSGGTANSVLIDSTTGGTNGARIVAFNGAQSPSGGIVTQTFATTAGVAYNLAFDLGVLAFNTNQQSIQVTLSGNGSLLSQTATINGIGNGTVKWEAKTYSFTANSSTTTLTFTDTSSTTNSIDMLLDNVRVTNANSRTLTVNSIVASGVALTVSPADNDGASSGNAQLTRNYNQGTSVNITAPSTASNGATFVKWVKDGVDFAVTPATSVTVSANTSLIAVYTGGSFSPLGPSVLLNGSFETLDGSAWAASWGRANSSNRIEQPGAASGFPTNGNNILSFNVGGTPTGGVASQSFPTTIGTSYTLQLDIGAYGGPAGAAVNQTLNISVVGSGSLLSKSVTLLGGGGNSIAWAPRTYTFTANSATTFLYLSDGSATGNGTDLFVDNVRVRSGTQAPSVITVNTTPANGMLITATPGDLAGQGDGTTGFTRIYDTGSVVKMVAPHTNFVKWLKNGQWYATNPSINLVVDGSSTMTAVYTTTPVLGPFTNGSFENEFAGWTWTGGQQTVKVKDGLPSTDGLIIVEFNSNSSGLDGAISQTFTTTPGTLYNLTFDVGTKAFNTSTQTLKCQVTGNGSLVNQNFSITGVGGGNVIYSSKSVSFTANSPTTTLTFSDQSFSGDGLDLLLDNVRLNGSLGTSSAGLTPAETGTNPLEVASSLAIVPASEGLGSTAALTSTAPGEFTIKMDQATPGSYVLERSEDLSIWEAIKETEITEPGPLEFHDAPDAIAPGQPKPKMFYRIGLKPAAVTN